jgi:hypothetical protein
VTVEAGSCSWRPCASGMGRASPPSSSGPAEPATVHARRGSAAAAARTCAAGLAVIFRGVPNPTERGLGCRSRGCVPRHARRLPGSLAGP